MSRGVLVADRVRITQIPGLGGPVSLLLGGTVGGFKSPASFRVQGTLVDASSTSVIFTGGARTLLANGSKVTVVGSKVVDGVLQAEAVIVVYLPYESRETRTTYGLRENSVPMIGR